MRRHTENHGDDGTGSVGVARGEIRSFARPLRTSADLDPLGTPMSLRTPGPKPQKHDLIARVLDRAEDATRYDKLSANAADAWQQEFLADDGTIRTTRQADAVRALAFDLVPDEVRTTVANQLVAMVRAAGTHLNTGFLATPYLLPVLADNGHLNLAYELLFQDTPPSWLAMIDRGATTIWEHWEGIDSDGVAHASLNHYSKGAVISFLHRYVAGIQPLDEGAGYRRFRVAPRPGGGLTWASAALESPYGRIESSWERDATGTTFRVKVPPNTEAEIVLPDGQAMAVSPGCATFHLGCER